MKDSENETTAMFKRITWNFKLSRSKIRYIFGDSDAGVSAQYFMNSLWIYISWMDIKSN